MTVVAQANKIAIARERKGEREGAAHSCPLLIANEMNNR